MVKSFKEYFDGVSYVGGVALGNPSDNVTPIASLGDVPPKDMSGKDSRGVGLHDADKNPNDKDSKEKQRQKNFNKRRWYGRTWYGNIRTNFIYEYTIKY